MIWATLIVFTIVSMGLLLIYRLVITKMAAASMKQGPRRFEHRRPSEPAGERFSQEADASGDRASPEP